MAVYLFTELKQLLCGVLSLQFFFFFFFLTEQVNAVSAGQGSVKVEAKSPSGHTSNLPVMSHNGIYNANFTPAEVGKSRSNFFLSNIRIFWLDRIFFKQTRFIFLIDNIIFFQAFKFIFDILIGLNFRVTSIFK